MSSRPAVRVDAISKAYRLAPPKSRSGFLNRLLGRSVQEVGADKTEDDNLFWALRDVSLDIPTGSTVGVLGLNGAGKSTLLKIISGALQPTSGSVECVGDVAFIELGAGFNPHMTARDNIRMLGRQRGLSAGDIEKKISFAEEFADIGLFFDQPMNTYSSGMRSRVGFANAFSVEPEILISDEALSVGDARFARRCFDRFQALKASGCTILLASHDRYAIQRNCDHAFLLHKGELVAFDKPKTIAELYSEVLLHGEAKPLTNTRSGSESGYAVLQDEVKKDNDRKSSKATPNTKTSKSDEAIRDFLKCTSIDDIAHENPLYSDSEHRYGDGRAKIVDFLVQAAGITNPSQVICCSHVDIYMKVYFKEAMRPVPSCCVTTHEGLFLYGTNSNYLKQTFQPVAAGHISVYKFTLKLDLHRGAALIGLGIEDGDAGANVCDSRNPVIHLDVALDRDFVGLVYMETSLSEAKLAELELVSEAERVDEQ